MTMLMVTGLAVQPLVSEKIFFVNLVTFTQKIKAH